MALIDSIERSINTVAQPKLEQPAVQPIQQQVDQAAQVQEQPIQAQETQQPQVAQQAEIAKAKLQADAFDMPVRAKTNLFGTTLREQAMANAETAALGQLDETQREQYLNTRDALGNDPAAQSSLRSLLLNGKLTQSEAEDGTGNLLDQLDRLSSPDAKTIEGVDRTKLLGQIVKDVSRPFTIDQGEGNFFCGATSALTGLAYRNPAEYARIAVDLGTEGKSALAAYYDHDATDGSYQKDDQIILEVKSENLADDRRSITQQLMAPALTEMGNGEKYDVTTDGTSVDAQGGEVEGTYADQVALMQEALTGEEVDSLQLDENSVGEDGQDLELQEKKDFLNEQIAAGGQVSLKKEGHWFTVSAVDGDTATVLDNMGHATTVSLNDLFRHADGMTYDRNVHTNHQSFVQRHHHHNHRHEEAGGGLRNGGGTIDPGD